jgi:hypothetical protein
MKILVTKAAEKINEEKFNFHFNRNLRTATEDSKAMQVWEEENPEYATWNLILEN